MASKSNVALDAVVAVVVFALSIALLGAIGESEPAKRDVDALAVALAALASLPLVLRRRVPLGVFAFTAAASSLLNGLDYPTGPPLGPTVALYFLGANEGRTRTPRWLTAATVAAFFLLHAVAAGIAEDAFPTVPVLFGAVVWGGAWTIGDRVRQRRDRIRELEEKLGRAEREVEREQQLAVAEERTRIARDLHDSAGHAINVILVQAGAARLLGGQDPARAQAALATIEEVARETLGEIDQLVRALRDDDDGAIEPPPGLAALDTLVDRHRSAGLEVGVRAHGPRRPLPSRVDAAAYRILQEALTNAARHGDGRADVDLTFRANALELAVENPTPAGQGAGAAGHGIVGMRERAALLGGTVESETRDGIFRIRALLPYGGEAR